MNYDALIKKTVGEAVKDMTAKISKQLSKIAESAANKAAKQAYEAGRLQAERKGKDAYVATEKRLYAMADLHRRVEKNREKLQDLIEHPYLPGRSKDIARFTYSGTNLSDEDKIEAIKIDLQAKIASDENMIAEVEEALESLKRDRYWLVIEGRYLTEPTMPDPAIAQAIAEAEKSDKPPDMRTIARNRHRLVSKVAVRLFGADAL